MALEYGSATERIICAEIPLWAVSLLEHDLEASAERQHNSVPLQYSSQASIQTYLELEKGITRKT
jgi:hypothetical protein